MRWVLFAIIMTGCWSSTTQRSPATAGPGRTGFGSVEHARTVFFVLGVAAVENQATGAAAVSSADGRRVALWRVVDAGRQLQFCADAGCQVVDVGVGGPLVIVDPGTRGALDRMVEVHVIGGPPPTETAEDEDDAPAMAAGELPGTAHLGVWVIAPDDDALRHCAVGVDGPVCRPSTAVDAVLATQVIETPAGRRDVLWAEHDGAIIRCQGGPDAVNCQTTEERQR